MELRVRVTARASRDELVGMRDGVLHVRVTAPPVDGKANQAVCRLIARAVGVGRTSVTVIRGERSRDKVVRIEGVEAASVAETMARRVYSSDDGDLRKARPQQKRDHTAAGGRVKVRRETAGRRGKAVTTVTGVPVSDEELKALTTKLKKRCGVGGSAKDGVIELQGDHRETVVEVLKKEGYDVVLAGG